MGIYRQAHSVATFRLGHSSLQIGQRQCGRMDQCRDRSAVMTSRRSSASPKLACLSVRTRSMRVLPWRAKGLAVRRRDASHVGCSAL